MLKVENTKSYSSYDTGLYKICCPTHWEQEAREIKYYIHRFVHGINTTRNSSGWSISPHRESSQPHVLFSIFYRQMGQISCATQYCAFCLTQVHRQLTRLRFEQLRSTLKPPVPLHSWTDILEQHPRMSGSRKVQQFLWGFSEFKEKSQSYQSTQKNV